MLPLGLSFAGLICVSQVPIKRKLQWRSRSIPEDCDFLAKGVHDGQVPRVAPTGVLTFNNRVASIGACDLRSDGLASAVAAA